MVDLKSAEGWTEVHVGKKGVYIKIDRKIERQKDRLDDGWPESEKDVFQAALTMVVVKDSR